MLWRFKAIVLGKADVCPTLADSFSKGTLSFQSANESTSACTNSLSCHLNKAYRKGLLANRLTNSKSRPNVDQF